MMQVAEEGCGPSTLRCLICKQYIKVDGFLFHLYSYFKYTRNKCRDCEFSCNSEEQATLHGVSTKHTVMKAVDDYIESISAKILADCYKAATDTERNSSPIQNVVQIQPHQVAEQNCLYPCKFRQSEAPGQVIAEQLRNYVYDNHSDATFLHVVRSPQKVMPNQPDASASVCPNQPPAAMQAETDVLVSCTVQSPQKMMPNRSDGNTFMHGFQSPAHVETHSDVPVSHMVRSPKKDIAIRSSGSTESPQQAVTTRGAYTSSRSFIDTSKRLNGPANLRHRQVSNFEVRPNHSFARMAGSSTDDLLPRLNGSSSTSGLRDALAFSAETTSHGDNDLPVIRKRRRVRPPPNVAFVEDRVSLPVALESLMMRPKVACKKCGLEIDESYIIRRTHVLQNHCSDKSDPELLELLAAEMRICFPSFLAFSDDQCNLCGKQYARQRSKRDHVVKKHLDQFYNCMVQPCSLSYNNLGSLKKHIQYRHGQQFLRKSRENTIIWRQLEEMRRDHEMSLERQFKVCFPCDVSSMMVTRVVETRCLAGIPRASASEKVAHLLHGVTNTPSNAQHPADSSSSDSSGSDSDEDVQIIEPATEGKTSEQTGNCITPETGDNSHCTGDRVTSEERLGSSLQNDTNSSHQINENDRENKQVLQNYLMPQAALESRNQIASEAFQVPPENSVRYWPNGFYVEESISISSVPQPCAANSSSSAFGDFVH